jgi:hypothetical protein
MNGKPYRIGKDAVQIILRIVYGSGNSIQVHPVAGQMCFNILDGGYHYSKVFHKVSFPL